MTLEESANDTAQSTEAQRGAAMQPAQRNVLTDWTRALAATAGIADVPKQTLPMLVTDMAACTPDAPALLSDTESLSYRELAGLMARVARWAESQGLGQGDTVALLMENRPAYVALWLGLTRVGISVALLNTNLRGDALAHCFLAALPKAIIVSAALMPAWGSAVAIVNDGIPAWCWEDGSHSTGLRSALEAFPDGPLLEASDGPTISDRALLIYTSGTTGLPKAANVSHGRVLSWALWFAGMLDTGPADRMYDCLPLYHSVGGVVAVGALLARGGSVVIVPSFSASRFFDDIRRWDCTLAQYIGELCRYLVSTPVRPSENNHRLRAMCGNGLREDVWRAFEARFAIPRIVEFYAASEGTFSLYNMEGEPGAIGRVPGFLRHRFPAVIVQLDPETGEPARNAEGRCTKAAVDESGEALGRIASRGANAFEGYTDAGATERKILRDAFAPGDAWMRTGDLMRIDARGFWYFVDRLGDTFRWKGENVSTLEVAEVLRDVPGVTDACVYGVKVPRADGRAGMAALTVTAGFDIGVLTDRVLARLPAYARPVFLRLTDSLTLTGTMKHQTHAFADAGFDPATTKDRLLMFDKSRQAYEPLTPASFAAIGSGERTL